MDRRQARVRYIESLLPWGPAPVPSNTSPADGAVLAQAFRTTLAEARSASDTDLERILQDAAVFGDDTALRGGLTALTERDGGRERARALWLGMTGDTDLIDEAARLSNEFVLWRTRLRQLLAPIQAPDEVAALEAAHMAAQAATAASQATGRSPSRWSA